MSLRPSQPRNFLAGTPLDRAGERRGDKAWLTDARSRGRYLPVWRGRNLVERRDHPRPVQLTGSTLAAACGGPPDDIFLGVADGVPYFAAAVAGESPPALEGEFCDLRGIGHLLDPDEGALLAFARDRLAGYKVPARVFFSERELPRNATNKVLKRELKTGLLAALEAEKS